VGSIKLVNVDEFIDQVLSIKIQKEITMKAVWENGMTKAGKKWAQIQVYARDEMEKYPVATIYFGSHSTTS
jgi:hypothetical protein